MLKTLVALVVSLAVTSPQAADPHAKPANSPDGSVRRSKAEEIVTGRAPLPNECRGSACKIVSIDWLTPGFMFTNNGSKPVAIEIWFAVKADCIRARFTIAPAKTSGWGNTAFCKPYKAGYK